MPFPRSTSVRRSAIAAVVLTAIVAVFLSDSILFEQLPKKVERYRRKIGRRLHKDGLVGYWDFDEVRVTEWVHRLANETEGTRCVRGRFGAARQFVPGEWSYIRTSLPLAALGDRFTVSCWLRVPTPATDQPVCQYLCVQNGRLTAWLPKQKKLSCPLPTTGHFFHCAFMVDASNRLARIYVDGVCRAEQTVERFTHRAEVVVFGQNRWSHPASLALDEVAIWTRTLEEREIRALASARVSLRIRLATRYVLHLRLFEMLQQFTRTALRVADLFNPFRHENRAVRAGLPEYTIVLSKADRKFFNRYHNARLREGLESVGRSSSKRRVGWFNGIEVVPAQMEILATPLPRGISDVRKTFTVELDPVPPESIGRKFLFMPPESAGFLLELAIGVLAAQAGYPMRPSHLCVLRFNVSFEGLYYCYDLSVDPGLTANGAPHAWKACVERLPFPPEKILDAFDQCARRYQPLLLADRKCPCSSREVAHAIRLEREQLRAAIPDTPARRTLSPLERVVEYVREDLFLKDNPAPGLIVKDLDFSLKDIGGVRLAYRSLSPDVIDDNGRVNLPESGPVRGEVEVTCATGEESRVRRLQFDVLPARRRLPILRVEAFGTVEAHHWTPCQVETLDGEGRRSGFRNGHIRLRGNTALAKASKHYYVIRLDHPLSLGELPATRRLMLTSAYRDPTLMRDKLSYDLFRSFSAPGKTRHAPHAQFAEIVLNREYHGIYSVTDRVDEHLLGFHASASAEPRPVLYKPMGRAATFRHPNPDQYVQKIPDWKERAYWEPYYALIDFLGHATPEAFAAKAERLLDVDAILDFEILLLVTNNMEGQNDNLYIARAGGPEARFFLVPWDYDMTFRGDTLPSNHLFQRLHRDLPGYTKRFQERWRALRKKPLSNAALEQRIDEMKATLQEGVARNFERWPLDPGPTHEEEVNALRAWLAGRMARLDRYVDHLAPHPGTASASQASPQ